MWLVSFVSILHSVMMYKSIVIAANGKHPEGNNTLQEITKDQRTGSRKSLSLEMELSSLITMGSISFPCLRSLVNF